MKPFAPAFRMPRDPRHGPSIFNARLIPATGAALSTVKQAAHFSSRKSFSTAIVGVLAVTVWATPSLLAGGSTQPAAPSELMVQLQALGVAHAQQLPTTNPDAQLLLTADQLVYDNDAEKVTAIGNVRLDYDGYKVVAQRVEYNQKSNRVKAFGNVEILEPNGNKIFADEIDLTDDFGEGFVNALRVETPDNTRFAAESAERFQGQKTVFNHGVYTACEACKKRPNRPPLWQIKAEKVILDGVSRTVTYEKARFELFGRSIAYLPYFKHADPSVKRQSGFLAPQIGYADRLGFSYRQPYFFATGPSHDLTLRPTYYTRQGFLGDAEWRQRLENGMYTLRFAGISQQERDAFEFTPDNSKTFRGMAATTGKFVINPRWSFGWNVLAQTDDNFSRTYRLQGFEKREITNQIYLRGLNDRSYFDLSAYQFIVQNDTNTDPDTTFLRQSNQAIVRPVLDYNYVTTGQRTGGQINLDVNLTSLQRDDLSAPNATALAPTSDLKTYGFDGETTRASAELGWKKTFTSAMGLMLTPSATVRGDLTSTSGFASSATQVTNNTLTTGAEGRYMATAGLEARYPVLVRTATSSHVFEPIANVYARPDLAFEGTLPNEDAQSLVFDSSTLFQRDKFSGYDRIESGTRANVGLRYAGQFGGDFTLNALVGQSFHLGGDNPYAREDDLTNTGEESGLETDVSDFVAGFGATHTSGLLFNTELRLDNHDADLKRSDILLAYASDTLSLSSNYTFIAAQPDYAFEDDRHQLGGTINYQFVENWRAFIGAQYDIEDGRLLNGTVGMSYHDECFTFSLAFNETRSVSGDVDQSVKIQMSFRTLGSVEAAITDDDVSDLFESNNLFSN
ncbi:MAG: LPS-assembly protein LptD [Pseudomonadota bacterium]